MTAKPIQQGGIQGRTEATGRGVFYGLREFCSRGRDMRPLDLSPGLEGKRVVVQGLGNVGYHAAKFLEEDGGAKLVGKIEVMKTAYDKSACKIIEANLPMQPGDLVYTVLPGQARLQRKQPAKG